MPSDTKKPRRDLSPDVYALVTHVHVNCNRHLIEALDELKLTRAQVRLLHHLHEHPDREPTITQVARMSDLSVARTSVSTHRLEDRGLVEIVDDERSRRQKRVRITGQGHDIVVRLNAARLDGVERFCRRLDDAEHAKLEPALDELLKRPEMASCRPGLEADE